MKNFLVIIFLFLAGCASGSKPVDAEKPAVFYHRFYQGYRLKSVNTKQYEEIINTQFLPLFPKAYPHGLYAYRPALPNSPAGCSLPAEIALLTFENAEIYGTYRETEVGKNIRDAHTLVFNPDTSKSLVPESYKGVIDFEQAYNLKSDFTDYRNAESALIIHCNPRSAKTLLTDLSKIYDRIPVAENILFAVSAKHVAEYVFAKDAQQLERILTDRKKSLSAYYKKSSVIRLTKQKIGSSPVKSGQGLDAQW